MVAGDSPTFDGVFYSRIDKSQWVYQPNHTRTRHRYRGPRESQKINLEMQQAFTDMCKLDLEITAAEDVMTTYADNILNGVTYSDITYTDEDATPTNVNVTLKSLTDHARDLTSLDERLKRIENG